MFQLPDTALRPTRRGRRQFRFAVRVALAWLGLDARSSSVNILRTSAISLCVLLFAASNALAGYDLHITRAKDWTESSKTPSTLKEWTEFIKADKEFRIVEAAEDQRIRRPEKSSRSRPKAWWYGLIRRIRVSTMFLLPRGRDQRKGTKGPDHCQDEKRCSEAESKGHWRRRRRI